MADGGANVFSRWQIIISYVMRSTVHHTVQLFPKYAPKHTFTSARSISFYTPCRVEQLIGNSTETKLELNSNKEYLVTYYA